ARLSPSCRALSELLQLCACGFRLGSGSLGAVARFGGSLFGPRCALFLLRGSTLEALDASLQLSELGLTFPFPIRRLWTPFLRRPRRGELRNRGEAGRVQLAGEAACSQQTCRVRLHCSGPQGDGDPLQCLLGRAS